MPNEVNEMSFNMRHIPSELHRRWKTLASSEGVSMETLAHRALEDYIKNVLKERENTFREEIEARRSELG